MKNMAPWRGSAFVTGTLFATVIVIADTHWIEFFSLQIVLFSFSEYDAIVIWL